MKDFDIYNVSLFYYNGMQHISNIITQHRTAIKKYSGIQGHNKAKKGLTSFKELQSNGGWWISSKSPQIHQDAISLVFLNSFCRFWTTITHTWFWWSHPLKLAKSKSILSCAWNALPVSSKNENISSRIRNFYLFIPGSDDIIP